MIGTQWYRGGIAALLVLACATPARAQRRGAPRVPGMSAGLALGAAGVDVRFARADWAVGVLPGLRWRWTGARSAVLVAADVQPFAVSVGTAAGAYRALWLLPAFELRMGRAGLRAGLGMGALRFDRELPGDRTDFTVVTGAGASVPLPASLSLELAWRRTGVVRGLRSTIWSLQLARLWRI